MRWKNFAMKIVSQRHLNNANRQALHNWVKCAAESLQPPTPQKVGGNKLGRYLW